MSLGVVRKCPNKSLLSQANGLVKLQLGKTEEKTILFFNQTPASGPVGRRRLTFKSLAEERKSEKELEK